MKPILLASLLLTSLPLAFGQFPTGNPLSGLEELKDFQTRRASSSDPDWRNGNADARPISPGGTLTLAELEGPGKIVHIWFTIAHSAPFYSRLMTLRIYWDGEEHPSVECPIGDFFGMGHGIDKPFTSLPIRVSSDGRGRNCYWPMPFRKSARITVSNDSDRRCDALYFYIDWQKHKSLPEDTAYFHAMYRQEFPCTMGRNYLLADIVGRGHYVGTIQSVYSMSSGWYGEGDDFFFIDGAPEPQLRGTGTEDYFCDGWGFREQSGPFYGTPLWEGYDAGDRGTAYRFHIPDPITFTKSLRAEIEHKGSQTFPDGTGSGFIERDDLMSSVAFWYQTEPHKVWPALPPGPERLPFREHNLLVGYRALEAARHSEHPIEQQQVGGVTDDKQLWFKPADDQGWVELPFHLDQPESAELMIKLLHSWDYGIYRIKLDGKDLGQVDLYSPDIQPSAHKLGHHSLAAGDHLLRLECAGKNKQSKGYFLGVDALTARVPVYSRPPGFDLRKIQVPITPLRAGISKIDITPTEPVTLSGYASRKDLSQGVHDPLSARAVAFEHNGRRLVLVSTDLIGFYGTADRMRQAILDGCGLEPSELFLACIHTHSAPAVVFDPAQGHSNNIAYSQRLQQQLVAVVHAALADLKPMQIGVGSGASPIGANRRERVYDDTGKPKIILGRNPSASIDHEVQVLKLTHPDRNALAAVLFSYDSHSTSLGPKNYIISGDVHGLAEQFLEHYLQNGVVAAGFGGTSGNIDPWYRVLPAFKTTNGWVPEPILMGTMLGEEVAHVLDAIQRPVREGDIQTRLAAIQLPGKATASSGAEVPSVTFNITVGHVGDVAFVGLGGEVFNEIGQAIKAKSPFACTFLMTQCNGAAGYLPTEPSYAQGGYEVESSPFAPGSAELVGRKAVEMLNELAN